MAALTTGARAVGALLFALVLTTAACRDGVPLGGFEDPADAAAPPLVTEAGTATPDANAFRPLCAGTECPAPYGTCADDAFRCETNFDSDNTSCGACGVTCPAGLDCVRGNCGCPAGLAACGSGGCGLGCVDLEGDDFNCGVCGKECPFADPPPAPNMHLGCGDGACGAMKCDPGFGNCNGSAADGCETELATDPSNCNACGHACAPGQACEDGKCRCAPNETRCPGFGSFTYCADLANDAQDCGICGNRCPATDFPTRSICRLGRCELACPPGQADCDGDPANGCETLVSSDPRNCGGCGVPCDLAIGQPCVGGSCLLTPCDEGPTR